MSPFGRGCGSKERAACSIHHLIETAVFWIRSWLWLVYPYRNTATLDLTNFVNATGNISLEHEQCDKSENQSDDWPCKFHKF
jgi:hypothetical protein